MKNSILIFLGVFLTIVLTSFTTVKLNLNEPEKKMLTCGPPSDMYLVKVGTGKPLFPGTHSLSPNTDYKVYVESTQGVACVTSGSG